MSIFGQLINALLAGILPLIVELILGILTGGAQ